MASYSTLSYDQVNEILSAYGRAAAKEYRPLSGGLENTSFLVLTGGQRYVLTVLEQKSLDKTRDLARLLEHLLHHNFHTSRVIKTTAGALVSTFQEKPVLLKHYVPGKITAALSDETLAAIGGQMARLHAVPPPAYLPTEYSYGQQTFGSLFARGDGEPFVRWLKAKDAFIRENLNADLPRSFIHGDVFYDNVILSEDGIILTDFEEACYYYRIFDLAMAVVGMCAPGGIILLPKVRALLVGYQAVQSLASNEKAALRAFVVYAATAAAFWRYRQYHVVFPDKSMKNHHKAMKMIADDAFGRSDSEFNALFE